MKMNQEVSRTVRGKRHLSGLPAKANLTPQWRIRKDRPGHRRPGRVSVVSRRDRCGASRGAECGSVSDSERNQAPGVSGSKGPGAPKHTKSDCGDTRDEAMAEKLCGSRILNSFQAPPERLLAWPAVDESKELSLTSCKRPTSHPGPGVASQRLCRCVPNPGFWAHPVQSQSSTRGSAKERPRCSLLAVGINREICRTARAELVSAKGTGSSRVAPRRRLRYGPPPPLAGRRDAPQAADACGPDTDRERKRDWKP
jgi:hypothetical protein